MSSVFAQVVHVARAHMELIAKPKAHVYTIQNVRSAYQYFFDVWHASGKRMPLNTSRPHTCQKGECWFMQTGRDIFMCSRDPMNVHICNVYCPCMDYFYGERSTPSCWKSCREGAPRTNIDSKSYEQSFYTEKNEDGADKDKKSKSLDVFECSVGRLYEDVLFEPRNFVGQWLNAHHKRSIFDELASEYGLKDEVQEEVTSQINVDWVNMMSQSTEGGENGQSECSNGKSGPSAGNSGTMVPISSVLARQCRSTQRGRVNAVYGDTNQGTNKRARTEHHTPAKGIDRYVCSSTVRTVISKMIVSAKEVQARVEKKMNVIYKQALDYALEKRHERELANMHPKLGIPKMCCIEEDIADYMYYLNVIARKEVQNASSSDIDVDRIVSEISDLWIKIQHVPRFMNSNMTLRNFAIACLFCKVDQGLHKNDVWVLLADEGLRNRLPNTNEISKLGCSSKVLGDTKLMIHSIISDVFGSQDVYDPKRFQSSLLNSTV